MAQVLENNEIPVRITSSHCISACTLFLALRDVCVAPEAVFKFHAPKVGILAALQVPHKDAHAARVFASDLSRHRPELGQWFAEHGAVAAFYAVKTGAELNAEFGIPLCDAVNP